jgi:glutathione peroxidase
MASAMTTLHDFSLKSIDGKDTPLSTMEGKAVLVVNVASRCGFTPQYTGLERLYEKYRDRGLVVIGVPCNQFGGQEPGTEQEIKAFCETNYSVTFPLFSKVDVNGGSRHPLYAWLTAASTSPKGPGDVTWNFEKFLVGKDGAVRGRYASNVKPESTELTTAIEAAL